MKKLLLIIAFLCFWIGVKAQTTDNKIKQDTTVFTEVEVQPDFPGGEQGLAKFLQHNIVYPKIDKKKNITGKVYVQFVVEVDGSLTNFKILRTPSETIGDEVLRVLLLSPNWNPGAQHGKPVRVQFTLPVNFSLGK